MRQPAQCKFLSEKSFDFTAYLIYNINVEEKKVLVLQANTYTYTGTEVRIGRHFYEIIVAEWDNTGLLVGDFYSIILFIQ